jgi:hypothetical protein
MNFKMKAKMKTKLKFYCFFLIFCIATGFKALAQEIGVDSRGEAVFNYYALRSYRIDIDSNEPFSFTFAWPRWRVRYYYPENSKDTVTTMYKLQGISTRVSLLNSGETPVLTEVLKTPGVQLQVGFQSAIDTIYKLDRTSGASTVGYGLVGNFNNFKYYDATTGAISKRYPWTIGLEGNYNYFWKEHDSSKWHFRGILALHLSCKRTWNDEELLQFQEINLAVVTPTVVAIDDFKGRYGKLKNNVYQGRFTASCPIFLWKFNAIPYVVAQTSNTKIAIHTMRVSPGIMFNVMDEAVTYNNFNFPSMIGIGLDGIGDKFNVFLKGSFSIGKISKNDPRVAKRGVDDKKIQP